MNKIKRIIFLLLVVVIYDTASSNQQPEPPNYYPIVGLTPNFSKYAESFFNQLEFVSGVSPTTSNASFSEDGYFYRDYGTTRFGVKINGTDPGYYRSIQMGPWELVGSYKDGDSPHIIIMGKIHKGFAKTIAGDATLLSSDAAVNGPILIAKKFNRLTSLEKDRLVSAYETGFPIAALEPTPSDLVKLRDLMGLPASKNPKAKYILAGIYKTGLQTSTLKIATPISSNKNKSKITEADYANQASVYFRWVRDAEREKTRVSLQSRDNPAFLNLHDLVDADVNEVNYGLNGGNYNILTYFSSAYDKKGQYYIYGKQRGRMAQRGAYQKINDSHYKGLTDFYAFNNRIRNGALIIDSPPTTQGQTQITNGISWSLGGEFSGGGLSLLAGIEVESQHSYSIPDITIQNTSIGSEQDVEYKIALPVGSRVPDVAYNTFTAENDFIFKVTDSASVTFDQFVWVRQYDALWDDYLSCGWAIFCWVGQNYKDSGWWKDTHQPRLPPKQ